jgi:hypothetical protein
MGVVLPLGVVLKRIAAGALVEVQAPSAKPKIDAPVSNVVPVEYALNSIDPRKVFAVAGTACLENLAIAMSAVGAEISKSRPGELVPIPTLPSEVVTKVFAGVLSAKDTPSPVYPLSFVIPLVPFKTIAISYPLIYNPAAAAWHCDRNAVCHDYRSSTHGVVASVDRGVLRDGCCVLHIPHATNNRSFCRVGNEHVFWVGRKVNSRSAVA